MRTKAFGFLRLGCLLVGLAVFVAGGCGSDVPRAPLPAIPADAPEKAIAMYDVDKNGFLDAAELEKAPALKAAFRESSKVTANDIAASIAELKAARHGRLAAVFVVKHNGRPLQDATVTVVPEAFLGSDFQPGIGKTNQFGEAWPTVPVSGPKDVQGVARGFYHVEITKSGENIPAKYNTQTILGAQVGVVAEEKWPEFDLQY
jgi:hypothetical protein